MKTTLELGRRLCFCRVRSLGLVAVSLFLWMSAVLPTDAANVAPVLSGAGGTLSYTEGDGGSIIDSSLSIVDSDDSNIESASVTISSGLVVSEDELSLPESQLSPSLVRSFTTPGVAYGVTLSSDGNTAYVVDHTIPTLEQVAQWPATFVKWYGAHAFAAYYGVSLPTEAQWEYAAQGGQDLSYPTDDGTIDATKANYNEQNNHPDRGHVVAVKSYPPNPYGLYDMAGNVWEWCADWYDPDFYTNSPDPDQDPFNNVLVIGTEEPIESPSFTGGPGQAYNGDTKVKRGGSWNFHAATLESSARERDYTFRGNDHFGFRLANNQVTSAPNDYSVAALPSITFVSIPSGSFVMGNDAAVGPISDDFKPERTVNMSAFGMSEAEITNEEYAAFLNLALAAGLIEVTDSIVGSAGTFVIGSASSSYEGHKLIDLSGSRVLKDHDGDTTIDPENPLNQCWIQYDANTTTFSVKDPRSIDWDAFVFETGESRADWEELADDTSGLELINITNPANPSLIGTYDTPGFPSAVVISADGNTAYVTDDMNGLLVVDISIPASPSLAGSFNTSGVAQAVALSQDGTLAFIAVGESGLQVVNVSNPASLSLTGALDTSGFAQGIVLSSDGNTVFIADGDSGLHLINASNPASLSLIGTYNTPGSAFGVAISSDGNTAFVADDKEGLQIINIATPASPSLTGNLDTPGSSYSVRLSPDGKSAFVADRVGGIQVIDVSSPASPSLVDNHDGSGLIYDVVLSSDGSKAYAAGYTSGLQIVNLFISGTYTQATGVLSLSGAGTKSRYESVLEAVTYNNTSDNPTVADRTVSWIVSDGDDDSSGVSSTISITAVNDPPVSGADMIERGTRSVKVAKTDLLSNDSDPDTVGLFLTAVGSALPAGSEVRIVDNWVVYEAVAGAGSGSFEYTLSDGLASVTGTVSVSIADDREISRNIATVSNLGGGNFKITGFGIPGVTYKVQFTESLVAPITWSDLGTATVGDHGEFEFTDPSGAASRFYRTFFE